MKTSCSYIFALCGSLHQLSFDIIIFALVPLIFQGSIARNKSTKLVMHKMYYNYTAHMYAYNYALTQACVEFVQC